MSIYNATALFKSIKTKYQHSKIFISSMYKVKSQHFFLIYKDKCLSYTRARETLINRLREVAGNLNLGLHSLRSGGVTAAANAGINDRCLKRHGRWRADSSKDGYVADSLDRRLEVSKHLGL